MSALWAAIIFLAIFIIKIPAANGYVNIGDAVIYTCGILLPPPFAMGAAAIGGFLADVVSGYAIYAPFTFIIKPILLLWFLPFRKARVKWVRYWLPATFASISGAALYFLTDWVLFGFGGAMASIPGNLVQGAFSIALYTATAFVLEYKFKINNNSYKEQKNEEL